MLITCIIGRKSMEAKHVLLTIQSQCLLQCGADKDAIFFSIFMNNIINKKTLNIGFTITFRKLLEETVGEEQKVQVAISFVNLLN